MSKLINCKACDKEIAKGAVCPNCGKDQRNFFSRHKVLTGFGVIICLSIISAATNGGGNSGNTPSTETTVGSTAENTTGNTSTNEVKEDIIQISASQLAKAYVDNEVSADKSYKDKKVEVSGKITDIGVILGQTYIVLSSGDDYSITDIQCFFDDQAEIDKVANLSKGDTCTIQGKVDGKSLNVGVRQCNFK